MRISQDPFFRLRRGLGSLRHDGLGRHFVQEHSGRVDIRPVRSEEDIHPIAAARPARVCLDE